ncbi:hypothetical protein O181_103680 [Austropuccinia psidii MF-1]|uniref:Uncharacterized protein n=1 Tax=Austropuccinia psidii MF-1 TaxID=1389203 RepID=A0A9Q3JM24_9BASI|nr:hypothetical protein [Austropuccinia psidii MF-1]
MPRLSTPFSHIRSPIKLKEELTDQFITDLRHQDNNKVLMKEAPQLKEWPTFTGESEYDHMSFIKTIDMLQGDYAIQDELITARLHSLFEKSAKRWYCGIRQKNGKNTWSRWKQERITKWANDAWRYKIENEFERSFFDLDKDKPLTCRCIEPCSTEDFVNALEDIVTRTKICRTWKKLDIKSTNKPFIKKDKSRETLKPNTSKNNEQRKRHKCGGIGHLENNCLKKAKINEILETEDHNDKEEESDSEKDTEESDSEKDTEESDSEKDTE